ncbi:hypothetical protein FN976_28595 [Caenimonas sedimenti]|uniref:Uncharacterized protein n=1 Tax=Caenimonas sedimenti TaxID=2596921 RepID=A0A562ZDB8_9BURK|nr:HAD domain-containing protein [Caenimonas sedimenti]TWO63119.1 hypothetical protein FN976_28595 [Caenimonas sedimenti]
MTKDQGHFILFLDFDGVLHPAQLDPERPLFCRMGSLEHLMQRIPGLRIVVSSSWRETRSLKALRELFPASVRNRVIGRTPVQVPVELLPTRLWSYVREAECTAWMRRRSHLVGVPPGSDAWMALDDESWRFSPDCAHLVLTDGRVGLTDEAVEELIGRAAVFGARPIEPRRTGAPHRTNREAEMHGEPGQCLWTVWADYFATGEGRTFFGHISHARNEDEARTQFARAFDPFFLQGAGSSKGVVRNEVTHQLWSEQALKWLESLERRGNVEATSRIHINLS